MPSRDSEEAEITRYQQRLHDWTQLITALCANEASRQAASIDKNWRLIGLRCAFVSVSALSICAAKNVTLVVVGAEADAVSAGRQTQID
jgi:hypothetical protein